MSIRALKCSRLLGLLPAGKVWTMLSSESESKLMNYRMRFDSAYNSMVKQCDYFLV